MTASCLLFASSLGSVLIAGHGEGRRGLRADAADADAEEVPMFLIDTLLRSLAYGRLRLKLLDIALQLFQPNLSERRQLSVAPRWRDVLHDADT